MSKRQHMLQSCRGRTAKRRQQQPETQRQHLYLVVDDWEKGYSVRKIDVNAFDHVVDDCDDAGVDLDEETEPLPEPPVVRFRAPHCDLRWFGGHGSILAMPVASDADNAFPVFDTETLGLALCAHPAGQKVYHKPIFASVAGNLYMIVCSTVYVLGAPPRRKEGTQWSWNTALAMAPVGSRYIISYALHPDGRTLFFSDLESTFSFHTRSLSWTRQGNWALPFTGQAYFDDALDAWVGLCRYEGGVGYVCSSEVPPPVSDSSSSVAKCSGSMPAWKLCKDQLFSTDGNKRHLGATLLYMGNNRYCLVESLLHKCHRPFKRCSRGRRCRVLYVTKFGLKYDEDGELRTTRLTARSYELMEGHELNDLCSAPVAFWM